MGKGSSGGLSDRQLRANLEQQKELFDLSQAESARRFDQDFAEGRRRFDNSIQRGLEQGINFENLYSKPIPELAQLRESIVRGSTPGQERAEQATRTALAQAGVRGPVAALEQSRQSGLLTQEMQRQLDNLAFQEAMDRRTNLGQIRGRRTLQGLGGQG